MDDLTSRLADDAGGVFVSASAADLNYTSLVDALVAKGFQVAEWVGEDGPYAAENLMMTIIRRWALPDVYAANWNAIAEGLHVRGLEGPGKVALLITNHATFSRSDPIQWDAGIEILSRRGEEWRARGGTLRVVLIDP